MRYAASKAYVANSSFSSSSFSAPSARVSMPSAPSSSSGMSLAGYTGRVTAAGMPDMRTTEGKAWAAANK